MPQSPTVEHGPPPGSIEELRDRIAGAYRQQFPNPRPDNTWAYVVGTFPDEGYIIVAVEGPAGEQYFRHDFEADGDGFSFGAAVPLEVQYVPADVQAEAARLRAERVGRADIPRRSLADVRPLTEASYDRDGRTLSLTVIQAGFNVSRTRYYTEAALSESGVDIFRGLKMYANHQTAAEARERPEGDVWQWVASITETSYDPARKRIRATARITDARFAEKVEALDDAGLLHELGVSIRAVGAGAETVMEGAKTFRVDEFVAGRSVDFVTEPGAGGYVEFRESDAAGDIETVTLSQLRERRPDLVAALLSQPGPGEEGHMTITQEQFDAERQRAEEAERKAREVEERAAAAEAALEEMKAAQERQQAQEAVGKLITESKLPERSQQYLREALAEETDEERAKAAIEAHRKLIDDLRGAGQVRDHGQAATEAETQTVDLKATFAKFGFADEVAEVAARGRR